MSEREKELESILKKLLKENFCGKDLEWSYIEGYSIQDVDPKLYARIISILPEVIE